MSRTQDTHRALELTDLLCRHPSVSAEGRDLDETAALVEELMANAGFTTQRLAVDGGAPAVYGEQLGEDAYTLLLYNHYDVQPVDPLELWDSPPFEPVLRQGRLYARGTADNKGEIAVRLAAIEAVRNERGSLPFTVRWIIEGEEEIGSPSFAAIARDHATLLHANACFWEGSVGSGDGRPVVTLGYKGLLAVRLAIRLLDSDAHSGLAAVLPSAAWKLTDALTHIRSPETGEVRIPGFYDTIRAPTSREQAVVAAQGNGIVEALRAAYAPARFVDGLDGAALRERVSFAPTCNIAGLQTGYTGPGMKTVLPRDAAAQIDFRLVRDQDPDEVFEALRAHLEAGGYGDIELTKLTSAEPVATDLDDRLVARVTRIAEKAYGAAAKILPSSPATQPVLAALRRSVGVTGLAAPDNPPHQGSAIHAPNEHIRLEELGRSVAFFRQVLTELHREMRRE